MHETLSSNQIKTKQKACRSTQIDVDLRPLSRTATIWIRSAAPTPRCPSPSDCSHFLTCGGGEEEHSSLTWDIHHTFQSFVQTSVLIARDGSLGGYLIIWLGNFNGRASTCPVLRKPSSMLGKDFAVQLLWGHPHSFRLFPTQGSVNNLPPQTRWFARNWTLICSWHLVRSRQILFVYSLSGKEFSKQRSTKWFFFSTEL